MGDVRNAYTILVVKPEGEKPLCVDERLILKWTLKK
jgi:hypothetical protein